MAEDGSPPSASLKRPWSHHHGPSLTQNFGDGEPTIDLHYGSAKRTKEVPEGEPMAGEETVLEGRLCCFGPEQDGEVCGVTANERRRSVDAENGIVKLSNGHHSNKSRTTLSEMDSTSHVSNGHCDPDVSLGESGVASSEDNFDYVARAGDRSPSSPSDNEDDNVSEISELSGISIEGWRPVAGPISWVQRQMEMGVDPHHVLQQLVPRDTVIPEGLDQFTLWKIVVNILSEPPERKKLKHVNTLEDVVHLLKTCRNVMVLTGAGVSVSCGIPDFRSKDGIYSRLAVEYPDLPDPQAMFDIQYFKHNPYPFFKFAKEIYPGQFLQSSSHRFIRLLEQHKKLLRNYTQNIDTLEQVAGISNVIQCHGSFASATCMTCKHKASAEDVRGDIMNQIIPRCSRCPVDEPLGIMKPDIVFFGESLPNEFHNQMEIDKDECDLLIVIGSSLKVRPVALIPNSLPQDVPQVLINRESLRHLNFDVELLGDCDVIVNELCHRLGDGWTSVCTTSGPAQEMSRDEMSTPPASNHQSPMSTHGQSDENSRMSFENSCRTSLPHASSETSISNMSVTQEESVAGSQSDSCSGVEISLMHLHTDSGSAENSHASKDKETSCMGMDLKKEISPDSSINCSGSQSSVSNSTQDTYQSCVSSPQPQRTCMAKSSPAPPNSPATSCPSVNGDSSDSTHQISRSNGLKESDVTSTDVLQELRACWQPRRFNLASRLKQNRYLFLPPSRYVFHGAEVYDDEQQDSDDDSSQHSNSDDEKDLHKDHDHFDLDENAQTGDLPNNNHGNSHCDQELDGASSAPSSSAFSTKENGWSQKTESDESSLSL